MRGWLAHHAGAVGSYIRGRCRGGRDETLEFNLPALIEGALAGTVTDAATGTPIRLAEIAMLGNSFLAAASEGDGGYRMEKVPAGTHDFEVRHPAYFPATQSGVQVAGDTTVALDVQLVHRPTTGALAGVVRDGESGAALSGVQLVATGGASAVSAGDGSYRLDALPAGLVEVSLTAAGYPVSLQTAAVDADTDFSTPTTRTQDFAMRLDGAYAVEATAAIPMGGASLELPDGSATLHFLPLALSKDGVVTLRRRTPPSTVTGDVLIVDPALQLPEIVALGGELELEIESAVPGEPAPMVSGAVYVELRYSAAEAASLGIHEPGLMPFYDEGAQWTLPRLLPHQHAVDTLNKRVVAGMSLLFTESGAPVTASLGMEEVRVAGFDLPFFNAIRGFVLRLGGLLEAQAGVDHVSGVFILDPLDIDLPEKHWNANALPLLVFHGWSPGSVMRDVDLTSIHDERYEQILRDLGAATAGVYRPTFVTYNSRMGLEAIGQSVRQLLDDSKDQLRGVSPDPDDPDAKGKAFEFVDSFGFSMGGLAERSYQSVANPDLPIRSMVSMGTPHHGGLQLARLAVSGGLAAATGFQGAVGMELLMSFWSPGTADLLDYSDTLCAVPVLSRTSGNPTLCNLNRNPRSAPERGLGVIAGTDSMRLRELFNNAEAVTNTAAARTILDQALEGNQNDEQKFSFDDLFSVGFLTTGCVTSDSIVCEWSATGRQGGGPIPWFNQHVKALRGKIDEFNPREPFNHLKGGGPSQPINTYAATKIVPTLSDWVVGKTLASPIVTLEPTETTAGELSLPMSVQFNVHHGDITGVVRVVYGEYEKNGERMWRIIDGADAEGNPNGLVRIERNSLDQEAVEFLEKVKIPPIIAGDPTTVFVDFSGAIQPIGPARGTVPLVPTEGFFAPIE